LPVAPRLGLDSLAHGDPGRRSRRRPSDSAMSLCPGLSTVSPLGSLPPEDVDNGEAGSPGLLPAFASCSANLLRQRLRRSRGYAGLVAAAGQARWNGAKLPLSRARKSGIGTFDLRWWIYNCVISARTCAGADWLRSVSPSEVSGVGPTCCSLTVQGSVRARVSGGLGVDAASCRVAVTRSNRALAVFSKRQDAASTLPARQSCSDRLLGACRRTIQPQRVDRNSWLGVAIGMLAVM